MTLKTGDYHVDHDGITSTDGMREAASFLHSIGALFYCRQEGRELVILNPQVRGVYKGKERL